MVKMEKQGYYTLFGFTRDVEFLKQRIFDRLGIEVRTIDVGEAGQFYYYSNYGDIAESEEAIVLKFGFLRLNAKSPLTAQQLLDRKLVDGKSIHFDAFSGNGLVIGISKQEASFCAFQTLMAVPQLYYSETPDGIVCSDMLRCLIRLVPHCELDETIMPQHFLFRSVYGTATYFQGVKRLIPGQYLRWVDGNIEVRLARILDVVIEEAQYIRDDDRAMNLLCEALEGVVGDYVRQIEGMGKGYANLLSGGVDSTLVQYFINATSSQRQKRSISYAIQVPAFAFEVEYARQASQLLHTEHTFVDFTPQDYPGLLNRVIEILAQPPNLEIEPSFLAVAEHIHTAAWQERFFFSANAADAIFGNPDTLKLKGLEYLRRVPGVVHLLNGMGGVLALINKDRAHTLRRGAEIIANRNNPDAYCSPLNTIGVAIYGENWNVLRRCFGDQVIQEALASRRNLTSQYSVSKHYLDKVHFIDQFTFTYEIAVQEQQLFLANNLEQVHPFNDEELLRTALTFHPDIRYIKNTRSKHLLKRLLYQKTSAPVSHMRKGGSATNEDLLSWMSLGGSLRPFVEDIDRPSFMEKKDFDRILKKPDYFLWPLLTLDVFKKRVLGSVSTDN